MFAKQKLSRLRCDTSFDVSRAGIPNTKYIKAVQWYLVTSDMVQKNKKKNTVYVHIGSKKSQQRACMGALSSFRM